MVNRVARSTSVPIAELPSPRISWGSVVAYHVLSQLQYEHNEHGERLIDSNTVDVLVTLGSPLGTKSRRVRGALRTFPATVVGRDDVLSGDVKMPDTIKHWLNYWMDSDRISGTIEIADSNHKISYNGDRPHQAYYEHNTFVNRIAQHVTAATGLSLLGGERDRPEHPVLLLHGLASSSSTWDGLKTHLEEGLGWTFGGRLGIMPYDFCRLEAPCAAFAGRGKEGDFYTANFSDARANYDNALGIVQQGREVGAFLARLRQLLGDDQRFIIVAHSMGGLAARSYIAELDGVTAYAGDVAELITYGTPHAGSPFGDLLERSRIVDLFMRMRLNIRWDDHGVRDMTPGATSFLDSLRSAGLRDDLKYTSIVSTVDCREPVPGWLWPHGTAAWLFDLLGPSDCVVPAESQNLRTAMGLTGERRRQVNVLLADHLHMQSDKAPGQTSDYETILCALRVACPGDALAQPLDSNTSARDGLHTPVDEQACLAAPTTACLFSLGEQAAERTENLYDRLEALALLAAMQRESGDFDGALATARRAYAMQAGDAVAYILAAELSALAEVGAYETALQLASEHPAPPHALKEIALAQAADGQPEAALATLSMIESPDFRRLGYPAVAAGLARAGEFGRAQEIASKIDPSHLRVSAYSAIAKEQSARGDSGLARTTFAHATATADNIINYGTRVQALLDVAQAHGYAGEAALAHDIYDRAAEIAINMGDLRGLAIVYMTAGDFAKAFTVAEQIDVEATRASTRRDTLVAEAREQLDAGDVVLAREALARAAENSAAGGSGTWLTQARDFLEIARLQVEAGDIESAENNFAFALDYAAKSKYLSIDVLTEIVGDIVTKFGVSAAMRAAAQITYAHYPFRVIVAARLAHLAAAEGRQTEAREAFAVALEHLHACRDRYCRAVAYAVLGAAVPSNGAGSSHPEVAAEAAAVREDVLMALLREVEELYLPAQGQETPPETAAGRRSKLTIAPQEQQTGLTLSDVDGIRRQIEPCWDAPDGVASRKDMMVRVRVILYRDGRIHRVHAQDKERMERDVDYRAVVESAKRALQACSPLELPLDKYELWRDIMLTFHLRDAVGR